MKKPRPATVVDDMREQLDLLARDVLMILDDVRALKAIAIVDHDYAKQIKHLTTYAQNLEANIRKLEAERDDLKAQIPDYNSLASHIKRKRASAAPSDRLAALRKLGVRK